VQIGPGRKPVTSHVAGKPEENMPCRLWTYRLVNFEPGRRRSFFLLKCELRDFCAFLFSPGSSRMSSSSEPSSSSSSSFAFLLTVEHYKCQRIATSDFSFIFMNALNFSSAVGGIYTHPLY